jgi:hypothetical protein
MKGKSMKTAKVVEIRKEYRREDLGKCVRGKYFEEYKKGTNLILLSPDVAEAFPDDEAVNTALRNLPQLAKKSIGPTRRAKRCAKAIG